VKAFDVSDDFDEFGCVIAIRENHLATRSPAVHVIDGSRDEKAW
jgi:hypothetical protein